jgi:hypothetical protein
MREINCLDELICGITNQLIFGENLVHSDWKDGILVNILSHLYIVLDRSTDLIEWKCGTAWVENDIVGILFQVKIDGLTDLIVKMIAY